MSYLTNKALVARLNRKLNNIFLAVRKSRDNSRYIHDLGEYYLVAIPGNSIVEKHIDLEDLAREHKCLREHERLVS